MRLSHKLLRRASIVIAAFASMLGSRGAWASQWIMGGTQVAPTNQYFTEVVAQFQVPPAPPTYTTNQLVSIWPGVEGTANNGTVYVLQPVLRYESVNGQNPAWYMRNEVFPGAPDAPTLVSPGDTIVGAVWLDINNIPTGCNGWTGANCYYNIGWADLSTNPVIGVTKADYLLPASPTYAQGLIFEAPGGSTYDSCRNFPYQTSTYAYVWLYTFTLTGGTYTPLATNLAINYPGINGFRQPILANGQTPFSSCKWSVGVGNYSSTIGEVLMGFAQ